MTRRLLVIVTMFFFASCNEEPSSSVYEGDDPGECSDGADNDIDGLFDCNDHGCSGSPECGGDGTCSSSASQSTAAYLMWYLTRCSSRTWTVIDSWHGSTPDTCYIGTTFTFNVNETISAHDQCTNDPGGGAWTTNDGTSVAMGGGETTHHVQIINDSRAILTHVSGTHEFTIQLNGSDTDICQNRIQNPENGHWYQRFDESLSWHDARSYCESLGGHLATITSEMEDDFVWLELGSNAPGFTWLGATDEMTEGTWEWVTGETWAYSNWGSAEPNNSINIEHYLVYFRPQVSRASYWNDIGSTDGGACGGGGCTNEFYLMSTICEWEEDPVGPC